MKHAIVYSLLSVLLALLLPMLWAPSSPPALPTPSPGLSADETLTFTVLTETGTETADLASYLPGVLAGEMPALFEPQALMAQAVAARTYILHRMQHTVPAHPQADICNDPACCKAYATQARLRESWGERYEAYAAKLSAAVQATDGLYLSYEGEPIEAVFHSSSLGTTEASAAIWNPRPYLVSVESPETAAEVPNLISEAVFTAQELQSLLSPLCPQLRLPQDPAAWITDLQRTPGGRVDSLCFGGIEVSGTQARSALQLRSADFTVDCSDGVFTFTVSGYGHGVGMSQYGANVYAKQGWSYEEILSHYYPNTKLSLLSQPASTAG